MAQLPTFRRIIIEDYPEKDRELISKLAYSINQPMEQLIQTFNKNIGIENVTTVRKVITVTVDASGIPTSGATVLTGLTRQCGGTQVIRAVNTTTSTNSPTSQPFISFSNNAGLINISKITGLQANEVYELTVDFFPV